MGQNKKEFFLNRWFRKMADYFDRVFEVTEKEGYERSSKLCLWDFWAGVVAGAIVAVTSMINDASPVVPGTLITLGVFVLVMFTVYLIKDIKHFDDPVKLIWRICYLLFIPAFCASIGAILTIFAIIVVIIILVLWLVFTMIFGTNEKKKLSNGDVVTNNGIFGWTGKSGKTYNKRLDGKYEENE